MTAILLQEKKVLHTGNLITLRVRLQVCKV